MNQTEVQAERNAIIDGFKPLIALGLISRESLALALTKVTDTDKSIITVEDGKVRSHALL